MYGQHEGDGAGRKRSWQGGGKDEQQSRTWKLFGAHAINHATYCYDRYHCNYCPDLQESTATVRTAHPEGRGDAELVKQAGSRVGSIAAGGDPVLGGEVEGIKSAAR